jgi:hypothetical protein
MTHPMIHPNRLLLPYDGPRNLAEQMQLATLLCKAEIGLPPVFRGDAGGVLALMYRAMSLDIPLMVAADNLIFDHRGNCAMRARLMKALVTVRAGHRLIPVETTDKRAVVRLEYADGRDPFVAEWTIATAVAAGLVKDKSPWSNYAANMLYWRAMAKAVALGCPEATLGIMIVEALDDDDPNDDTDTGQRPAAIPEEIIVTDMDGRPVPDGSVTDILNEIAQPEPGTGRPLALPDTTIEDLRTAWGRANRQPEDGTTRPLKRFAWSDGNDQFTLEQIIGDLVEQVTARDKAKATAEAEESAEETAKNPGAETMTAPAGTGTLPCGCDATIVATTGAHLEGCAR